MEPYVDIIGLFDAALMLCNEAALQFQAHANYGTSSIDFDKTNKFSNFLIFYHKQKF